MFTVIIFVCRAAQCSDSEQVLGFNPLLRCGPGSILDDTDSQLHRVVCIVVTSGSLKEFIADCERLKEHIAKDSSTL